MRLPLPKSRLVALCLLAAVLTAAVAVGLANPGVVTNVASGVDDDGSAGAAADAAVTYADDDTSQANAEDHASADHDEDENDHDDEGE